MRSADWSVVGAAADSSAGTFFDPQVMVDDGLREPSTFIDSLAVPCPGASPGGDAVAWVIPGAVSRELPAGHASADPAADAKSRADPHAQADP